MAVENGLMNPRFRVAVTDYLAEATVEQPVLAPEAAVLLLQAQHEHEVADRAPDADALLVFHDMKLTAASLARLPNCRAVVRVGVGFDNVDLRAAGELGIAVCNVPDYGTEEVADHALMLLLAVARRLIPCHQEVVSGKWELGSAEGSPRLRGRMLGLVGCGRIGTAMALRAKALGLRVLFHDPYQTQGHEKALGVERCHTLEEMLPRCHFLSLHCPLTDETRHLVNARTLALLPRGAYLINTARGGCVDLKALADALDAGQVRSAGLDVFDREPLDDERIRRHPRLVLTPHTAFYSAEGAIEMRTKAAREAKRALLNEPLLNVVNLRWLKNPRCAIRSPHAPEATGRGEE